MPIVTKKNGTSPYLYPEGKFSLLGTNTKQKSIGVKPHFLITNFLEKYGETTEQIEITKSHKIKRIIYLGFWADNPDLIIQICKEFPRQWLEISKVCQLRNLINDEIIQEYELDEYKILLEMTPEELKNYDDEQAKARRSRRGK